jgi:hypothetical protein
MSNKPRHHMTLTESLRRRIAARRALARARRDLAVAAVREARLARQVVAMRSIVR